MKQTVNGQATATKANQERTQQYDEVRRVILISYEHDGRMTPEDAREYVAERVHSYATAHAHTIDEGTHILDVQDMGEPEPVKRPTFEEMARDEVENRYNNGDTTFTAAVSIAEAISKAVAHTHGNGNAARYMLDTIAYYVQSHCNTVLNDEDEDGE